MNDSLEFLFGKQTAIYALIESLRCVQNSEWRLVLMKLMLRLFKNSKRVQLLSRMFIISNLDSVNLYKTAARHIHQLIMVSFDVIKLKVELWRHKYTFRSMITGLWIIIEQKRGFRCQPNVFASKTVAFKANLYSPLANVAFITNLQLIRW